MYIGVGGGVGGWGGHGGLSSVLFHGEGVSDLHLHGDHIVLILLLNLTEKLHKIVSMLLALLFNTTLFSF